MTVKQKIFIEEYLIDLNATQAGINQDRVLRELARLAFVNPTDVINMEDATLKESSDVDDTAAIQSVKVKSFGENGIEREIKMTDKLRALELLGKHLGMFQNNLNLNVQSSEKLEAIFSQLGGEGLEE